MKDFFISYNSADHKWAEWIAWVLEEQGYDVIIQAWDFRPGGNFVLDMQRATTEAIRTIMVLSEAYLQANFTHSEWAAAFRQDPQSTARKLIPIRVESCRMEGILGALVFVDFVGKNESEARRALLSALRDRDKPSVQPDFPEISDVRTDFRPEFPSKKRSILSKAAFPGSGVFLAAPIVTMSKGKDGENDSDEEQTKSSEDTKEDEFAQNLNAIIEKHDSEDISSHPTHQIDSTSYNIQTANNETDSDLDSSLYLDLHDYGDHVDGDDDDDGLDDDD
jgi:hypothetical protein